MNENREPQHNHFGRLLEQLLLSANVKSATLAAALSYDVSYISKWITGKALPSRKNIEKILTTTSRLAAEQPNSATVDMLMDTYGVQDVHSLQEAIAGSLRDAYYEDTGKVNENLYTSNAALRMAPRSKFALLADFSPALNPEQPMHIAVMADIFSLDHVTKLQLAGIEPRGFRMQTPRSELYVDYIIDLDSLDGRSVYDVVLLIHMMTNFSLCNFRLYASNWAKDKLLIAVNGEFAGITMLAQDHQFLCTTSTRDRKLAKEVYDTVRSQIDPDRQVFTSVDMESILLGHEYFHNLLSQNNRWLVGHVTEHFIPEDLFRQLSAQFFPAGSALSVEAERAYQLASGILRKNRVHLIFYHLALLDFALSGEMDFFNHKVILDAAQRHAVLTYIRNLLQDMEPGRFKLVKEGFSDDFKYITNPCLFLSESASCLRLENKRYQNNLLLIRDDSTKKIFETFFRQIWQYEQPVLITDHSEIQSKLDLLIDTACIL